MTSSKKRKLQALAAALLLVCAPAAARDAGPDKSVLIVLEGITPDTDPARMKEMAQFLSAARIPFAIGVRPVTYTKGGKKLISSNRYLANNIRALSYDSTVLLQNTAGHDGTKLDSEIDEMIANDMLPLAFLNVPAAKDAAMYSAISGHFSTIVKETGVAPAAPDDRFQRVIFLRHRFTGGKLDLDILKDAERRSAPGEAPMGVMIGMDVDKDSLLRFIRHLRGRGYTFLDLRSMPNYVRSDNAIIISDTWYYAGLASGDTVYGDKKKMDLIKFKLNNSYLTERSLTRSGDPFSQRVSEVRLNGTALVDIPPGEAMFMARQSAERPDAAARAKSIVNTLVFGRLSSGPLDDIYRVLVLVLFLITASAAIYIVSMFIQAMTSGRSSRGF